MNEIVPFPPRLRLATSPCEAALARDRPRYHAFAVRTRRSLFEHWRQLVSSDELTDAELRDEVEATRGVLQTILDLHRLEHPAQPDQTPVAGAGDA